MSVCCVVMSCPFVFTNINSSLHLCFNSSTFVNDNVEILAYLVFDLIHDDNFGKQHM